MAAMDQLTGLANVLQAFQGQEQETKTRTKGTQTQQTNISDTGVNKLIQDILSGPGGVRSVGGAARSSGLYNSTTEDMLLGDLYSRAAVSAELARSPTTVTTDQTQTQTTAQEGISGGLGSIATMMAMSQGSKALFGDPATGSTGMLSGVGDTISGLFGGGAAAAPAATAGATSAVTPAVTGATIGAAANAIGPEIVKMGATTGAANATTAAAAGGASTAGGTAATGGAAAGSAGTAGAAAGGAASGFGMNMATAIPLGGSFLSGLIGGKDAATEPASLAMSAMAGAMALGPVGLIAAPIAAIAGGFLRDMSVVCTALNAAGYIDKKLHKAGETYFAKVDGVTKLGYWLWGEVVARKINDGSKFWIGFTKPVVRSYLKFLNSDMGILDCVDHPTGALAHYAGEAFCKWLGHAVILYKTKFQRYN